LRNNATQDINKKDEAGLCKMMESTRYTFSCPDLVQVPFMCQKKNSSQGNHLSPASLSMFTWQVSQKKQGRVISLPGKELDNTHLSSFHMVLFLTL
jgi:hypothetical protein